MRPHKMIVGRPTCQLRQSQKDERLLRESLLKKLLRRPELGAIGGAILVWVLFAVVAGDRGFLSLRGTANYLEVAAELGILSVAVALLMIGGEFDLSIGSIIGGAGMVIAILTTQYHWNIWPAFGVSLVLSLDHRRDQRPARRAHQTALLHYYPGQPVYHSRRHHRRRRA